MFAIIYNEFFGSSPPDPIEIVTDIPTIDVSNRTVGDLVPIVCQVETCLADVIVSIYKGDQVVFTSQAMEPFVNSVSFLYQHEVTANSAGLYACRGFTTQGSTPFHYFNITGEFLCFLLIGTSTCLRGTTPRAYTV